MQELVTSGMVAAPGDASPNERARGGDRSSEEMVVVHVPHVGRMLRTRTWAAVESSGLVRVFHPLDRGTKESYARHLATWFADGFTFVVIEQDIVCPPEMLRELAFCPESWCYHPYDVGHGPTGPMLGCAKFGREITHRWPEMPLAALRRPGRSDRWYSYQSLDIRVEKELRGRHVAPHRHEPAVLHLHDYRDQIVDQGGEIGYAGVDGSVGTDPGDRR